jgi:hypothetical protein
MRHAAAIGTSGEGSGEGTRKASGEERRDYFGVALEAEDSLLLDDDSASDDFLPPLLEDDSDFPPAFASLDDFAADFSDFSEVESLDSLELSVLDRLPPLRLSVRWNPDPLNTMPTGCMTFASLPPHTGCFFRGSSENDCHASSSSPHFAHS